MWSRGLGYFLPLDSVKWQNIKDFPVSVSWDIPCFASAHPVQHNEYKLSVWCTEVCSISIFPVHHISLNLNGSNISRQLCSVFRKSRFCFMLCFVPCSNAELLPTVAEAETVSFFKWTFFPPLFLCCTCAHTDSRATQWNSLNYTWTSGCVWDGSVLFNPFSQCLTSKPASPIINHFQMMPRTLSQGNNAFGNADIFTF